MKRLIARSLTAATALASRIGIAQAADTWKMPGECRAGAMTIGAEVDDLDVKYQGRRTDNTRAVNGPAFVPVRKEPFNAPSTTAVHRIKRFIVTNSAP